MTVGTRRKTTDPKAKADPPKSELTAIRLSPRILERIDALIPWMEKDPEVAPRGVVNRSEAMRHVILKGLTVLERDAAKDAKA